MTQGWVYDERYGTIGSVWDEDGNQIAQVSQMVPSGPEDIEDRRQRGKLLAEAPNLLAALKELCGRNWDRSSYERAQAAIDRAEGRSS